MTARSWPRPKSVTELLPWAGQLVGELTRRDRRMVCRPISLTASSTTTTVSDEKVFAGDLVIISAGEGVTAAESPVPYVDPDDVSDGSFIITHVSSADSTRKVVYYSTRSDGS